MSKSTRNDWIVIGEFDSLPDASIVAGAIENENIPTAILNSALQSTLPLTFTWAPVQLLVPPTMAARASEIVPEDNRVPIK